MRFYNLATKCGSLVVLATGILKLLDILSKNPYFLEPDSLFPILNHRQMMLLAAGLEIGLGVFCWGSPSLKTRSLLLIWFSSIVALYNIGLAFTFDTRHCSYLGTLGR